MSNMDPQKSSTSGAHAPSAGGESTVSQSRLTTLRKKAKKGVAEFFGIAADMDKKNLRWENRRTRVASKTGKGLKDGYKSGAASMDAVDGPPNIIDPLNRGASRQMSHMSATSGMTQMGANNRKKSVMQMAMEGVTSLSSARKDVRKKPAAGHSFPPGTVGMQEEQAHYEDEFSLVDDVFFDEHPGMGGAGLHRKMDLAGGPSAPGWRRQPPQALPSTPGVDLVDGPGFGLQRITQKVMDTMGNREKRQAGMGFIGKLMQRRLKSNIMTKDVKKQLDNLDDHRPYFTYWVTFVQILVYIAAVVVYGTAPIGIGTTVESANVKMPNLAIQTETHIIKNNLWIGPTQADLIHLGAKYAPCMRFDDNLNVAIQLDRNDESNSACCIRNDGGGCRQTVESDCSEILSRWEKWGQDGLEGPRNRTSGTVCGQDPRFCRNPVSSPPYEWADEITSWPICTDTATPNQSLASNDNEHMSCDILGRPCCFGIQGECIITTREHCTLKRGYFHEDAFLCSQVNCMGEICGMIPFSVATDPDQFYRLWTSLFLHGGLVHIVVTVLFQIYIMRDMEKLMGAIRVSIIYLGSGIAGNLAGCTFIPYAVECGPSGSQFGIVACMLVEVIQNRNMYASPCRAVMKMVIPIFFFFLLGLMPWFDNWAHFFGFLFGFLLAFGLMPYISFGKGFTIAHRIATIIGSLGGAVGLFIILVALFYTQAMNECDWCIYFNCLPFTADFCEDMGVSLKKNSTYSNWLSDS